MSIPCRSGYLWPSGVASLSISDPDVRALRRLLFADAADLDLDKQGRILIPSGLRDYAGLDRDAVVVGMHTFIELWSPERWSSRTVDARP
ncbi:MAG: hypothetical protein R2849_12135 [Thermomicrobiales bacterium]